MNHKDLAIKKHFEKSIPLFNALGDQNRQLILIYLKSDEGTSVNEITSQLTLSRPAVSHHLKILYDAGLLRVEKQGTSRLYCLDTKKALGPVRSLIEAIDKC